MIGIVLAGWGLLIIWGARIRTRNFEQVMTMKQVTVLKGICATEIVLGHIGFITESPVLFANRKAGILFVGMFLFLSGYGLMWSKEHKRDYLNHFIMRKALHILGPAYIIYSLFQIMECCVSGNMQYLFYLVDIRHFAVSNNWFVWEILGLYILFGIFYRYWTQQKANILLGAAILLFVGCAYALKMENPWYGSTCCFILGIFYYQKKEKITPIYEKHLLKIMSFGTILMVFCFGLFFGLGNDSIIGNPIARNGAACLFCVITIGMLHKITIGNKLSLLLGNLSYEIYLVHPYLLGFLKSKIHSLTVYAVAVMCLTIVMACIITIPKNIYKRTKRN